MKLKDVAVGSITRALLAFIVFAVLATACGAERVEVEASDSQSFDQSTVDTVDAEPSVELEDVVESVAPVLEVPGDTDTGGVLIGRGRVIRGEQVRAELIDRSDSTLRSLEDVDLASSFIFATESSHDCRQQDRVWLDIFESDWKVRLEIDQEDPGQEEDCEAPYITLDFFPVDVSHASLFEDSTDDLFTRWSTIETLTSKTIDQDFLAGIAEPTFISGDDRIVFDALRPENGQWQFSNNKPLLLWPGAACDPYTTDLTLVFDATVRVEIEEPLEPLVCEEDTPYIAVLALSRERIEQESIVPDGWRDGLSEPPLVVKSNGPKISWSWTASPPDFSQLRTHLITAPGTAQATTAHFVDHPDVEIAAFDSDTEFVVFVPYQSCRSRLEPSIVIFDDGWKFGPSIPAPVECERPSHTLRQFVIDRSHLPLFDDVPEGLE